MGKLRLTESQFKKFIRMVIFEQNEDEYYKISPKEFEELMKFGGYHGKGVTKLKMFGGKPIWITGDLDLHDTPTDSLGNVKYIEGKLDIRDTNISDLSGVEVKNYTWDGGTPIERRRKAEETRRKLQSAEERRFNKEWDIDNPDITELGEKANALYDMLVGDGEIEEPDEEQLDELKNLEEEIGRVANEMEQSEDEERAKQLYNTLYELKNRDQELRENIVTVYNIIPMPYTYYGLQEFEVVGAGLDGYEYSVGDEEEMDEAAYENPEVYFDESEMPTTEEQDRRREELEEYIENVKGVIEKLERKQDDLNNTIEDPDEYKKQWDEIEERIRIIKGHIDDSQEEIDNMVPEGEVTTQMVEDKVVFSVV